MHPRICIIVASHISIPERIPHLITCIDSLLQQTVPVTVYLSISFKTDELRTAVIDQLDTTADRLQQCPPTPSEPQKTFQDFCPGKFLTKSSQETTDPKGRRGFKGFPKESLVPPNRLRFVPRDAPTSQMKHIAMALADVKSTQDWIFFCDDDDTYEPNRIEKFLPFAQHGVAGVFESWVGLSQQQYRYEFWAYGIRPFVLLPFFEYLSDHPDILDQTCCDIMLVEYLRRLSPLAYRFERLDIPENASLYHYRKVNNEHSVTETIIKSQSEIRVGNPPPITDARFSDYIVEWNGYLYENLHYYMHDVYLRTVVGCSFDYILQKEFLADYPYLEYVDQVHVDTLRQYHERVRDICIRLYQVWDLN